MHHDQRCRPCLGRWSVVVAVRAPIALALFALVAAAGSARAAVLTVGIGQDYATLAAAVAAAQDHDTINVIAGTYLDQTATINKPLTIQGVGGTPVFTATTSLANRKGFLVVNADLTVNNITFSNAWISDADGANGAGIRYQAGTLVVSNSSFIGNQSGILATPGIAGTGSVLVQSSVFLDNGVASGPRAGFEHAIYATQLAVLTVEDSRFEGTLVGHDIKSRAAITVIEGNYLDDGVTGTTSYAIDLSNGGVGTIIGNTIVQGPNTQNSTMISYAAEGFAYATNSLLVKGNLFVNSRTGGSYGVANNSQGIVEVCCNAFDGVDTPTYGPVDFVDNVIGPDLPACAAVPEPASLLLFLAGSAVLGGVVRRRRAADAIIRP